MANGLTREEKDKLVEFGLSKAMADSTTAEKVYRFCTETEEGKNAVKTVEQLFGESMANALLTVKASDELATKVFQETMQKLNQVEKQINDLKDELMVIRSANEEFGDALDSKAKSALAFHSAILNMDKKTNADPNVIIRDASYGTWAYLNNGNIRMPEFDKPNEQILPKKNGYKRSEVRWEPVIEEDWKPW